MSSKSNYTVLTLDAGGTNFVFSAINDCKEVVKPVSLPSNANNLEKCLVTLETGFNAVIDQLSEKPVAISFAFPGPADYPNGIIGNLPNLSAFRGGIPLGPFLQEKFGIPVYINNDGDLFAYGEAMFGALPFVNKKLEEAGNSRKYKNAFAVTLGTGYGGGIVIDGKLLIGDNSAAGETWLLRNKKHNKCFVEESLSIRAVRRVYSELTGVNANDFTPKDIFDIAEGKKEGNKSAAIKAFEELGEILGDALANAVTLIDGIIIIGGGLAGASKYFIPSVIKEMNGFIERLDGSKVSRLEMAVYNLDDEKSMNSFIKGNSKKIIVPGTNKTIDYDPEKKIGIAVSKLGTSLAISLGAYAFALDKLKKTK